MVKLREIVLHLSLMFPLSVNAIGMDERGSGGFCDRLVGYASTRRISKSGDLNFKMPCKDHNYMKKARDVSEPGIHGIIGRSKLFLTFIHEHTNKKE